MPLLDSRTKIVFAAVGVWFLAAILAGALGFVQLLPLPFPQAILVTLASAVLLLFFRHRALREWACSVDLRVLIAVHITRFVGAWFLFLGARGVIPEAFAVPVGVGDIAVATAAICLILIWRRAERWQTTLALAWNLFGLVDILFAVFTGSRLGIADPSSMEWIARLPMSLLPTFLVPMIVATHVMMLVRLLRGQVAAPEPHRA